MAACSVVHSVCCLLPLVLYCWCCVACSVCWLLLSVSCGVCVSLGCVLLPAVSHACCSLELPALLCACPVRRFCPRVFLVALVVLSRLHLFLACISSWSVSRRCWSVSRRISLVVCHWSSCCCAPCPVLPLEFVCSARRVRPVRLASFVLPGQFRVLPACVCWLRGLAVTVPRVASHRLPCFFSGVACPALCSFCAPCSLSCYSLRSLLCLHLFPVCVSSWSVSRRCWSTSLPDLYIFLACIFVTATSSRPGLYISPVCISSLLVCISSWSVYLSGLYLVIATSSRPDLYKYISLSVSRRCIFVSSSVRWICVSDLLVYLEFRVSSGYSVSRMSCLLRCPCLPRISCPLVSSLSTSNLCAPVKNAIISRKSRDAQTHKHMVV